MNTEWLKSHLRNVTPVPWQDQTIYLRKINAADGVALIAKIKELSAGELGADQDREETVNYYVTVICKSVANKDGDLEFDTDEGRGLLRQLSFSELCELGELALRHGGVIGEKKSSQNSNASLSDSASPSDTNTPTPCTLS